MKLPRLTIREKFQRYYSSGPFAGILILIVVIFDLILYIICTIIDPKEEIDIAVDFPNKKYAENKEKYGDH